MLLLRMFERFSSQYYIGEMYIEILDDDTGVAQMNQSDFNAIIQQVYETEVLSHPLILKMRSEYVAFEPRKKVPRGSLRIPDETFEQVGYSFLPSLQTVLLPTKKCFRTFQQMGFFST